MIALTRREKAIVLYVLVSVVLGMGVKRCREWRRETVSAPSAENAGLLEE